MRKLVPVPVEVNLVKYKKTFTLQCIGGRTKNFSIGFSTNKIIPIMPYDNLSMLVVRYYHNKFYKDIDTTVTHVRKDVRVIKARKIVAAIESRCRICLERRHRCANQVMEKLPLERSSLEYPAWSCINMDLFGPITIKDDCVKEGSKSKQEGLGSGVFLHANKRSVC